MPAMISSPPTLETDRLLLTAHSEECFRALAEMWADASVARYIGGKPSTRRESWMRMLAYCGCWPLLGYGYWAVLEKNSRRYIGDVGFADFQRELDPPIAGTPEMGWAVAPWAQGKGIATEALNAALNWLDRRTERSSCVCLISPENKASIHMARKAGFSSVGEAHLNASPVTMFTRIRPNVLAQ